MKLKLFGFTILEIERDSSVLPATAGLSSRPITGGRAAPATSPPEPLSALAELHRPAKILPRTRRGTIDVEMSLQLMGITNAEALWHHRFKKGMAGAALKCILGASGRKPREALLRQGKTTLHTYPAAGLPVNPGTGKLDLDACLAMFGVENPNVLWQERFQPDSAGGRLKMCLRAGGFVPGATAQDASPVSVQNATPEPSSPGCEPSALGSGSDAAHAVIKREADGKVDIQASLVALGLDDPKALWQQPVDPGSAQHAFKKEIARRLARREPVPGITRADAGLTV